MSDFAGVMVKFSGGKAAATLLLAAAILAPPTTMGYMDFEVNKLKLKHPVSIEIRNESPPAIVLGCHWFKGTTWQVARHSL